MLNSSDFLLSTHIRPVCCSRNWFYLDRVFHIKLTSFLQMSQIVQVSRDQDRKRSEGKYAHWSHLFHWHFKKPIVVALQTLTYCNWLIKVLKSIAKHHSGTCILICQEDRERNCALQISHLGISVLLFW